jgi:hypothetical protein
LPDGLRRRTQSERNDHEGAPVVRVVSVFLIVLAVGLGLGAQLTYSAVETAYRDAVAARLRMIAVQIAGTIQTSQSFGIAVEAQDTVPALIEREAANVPDLAAIEIVAPDGSRLFSTRPDAPAAGEAVVVPAVNDLGQTIASVRIARDAAGETARLQALRRGLMARALPIALVALATAGAALALVARRPQPAPASAELP